MADTPLSLNNQELKKFELDGNTDLEGSETQNLNSLKNRTNKFLSKRVLISLLLFVFLVVTASVLIYKFVYKSLSVEKFSEKLCDHLDNKYPELDQKLKESFKNELKELYKQHLISDDYVLEFEILFQFENFIKKYKRVYSEKERSKRHLIFRERYLEVKNHKNENSYQKGINKFSDLTKEERLSTLRTLSLSGENIHLKDIDSIEQKIKEHSSDPKYLSKLKMAKNLDDEVVDPLQLTGEDLDWRRANAVTKVKDQRDCGSCWAFATVGSVESLYSIMNDKTLDLSEQYLVNCEKRSLGCNGGYADYALDFVRNKGLPTSEVLPYTGTDDVCVVFDENKYYIDFFTILNGKDVLNKSLVYSPTVVVFGVSDTFLTYKSGVYDGDCSLDLNHNVLLVGEGYDEVTKKRYWVLKNSWGTDWGENGYFRLERTNQGSDKCGVLTYGLNPFLSYYELKFFNVLKRLD